MSGGQPKTRAHKQLVFHQPVEHTVGTCLTSAGWPDVRQLTAFAIVSEMWQDYITETIAKAVS